MIKDDQAKNQSQTVIYEANQSNTDIHEIQEDAKEIK